MIKRCNFHWPICLDGLSIRFHMFWLEMIRLNDLTQEFNEVVASQKTETSQKQTCSTDLRADCQIDQEPMHMALKTKTTTTNAYL